MSNKKCGRIEIIPGGRDTAGHPRPDYCGRCGIIIESEVVGDVQRFRHGTVRIAEDIR